MEGLAPNAKTSVSSSRAIFSTVYVLKFGTLIASSPQNTLINFLCCPCSCAGFCKTFEVGLFDRRIGIAGERMLTEMAAGPCGPCHASHGRPRWFYVLWYVFVRACRLLRAACAKRVCAADRVLQLRVRTAVLCALTPIRAGVGCANLRRRGVAQGRACILSSIRSTRSRSRGRLASTRSCMATAASSSSSKACVCLCMRARAQRPQHHRCGARHAGGVIPGACLLLWPCRAHRVCAGAWAAGTYSLPDRLLVALCRVLREHWPYP